MTEPKHPGSGRVASEESLIYRDAVLEALMDNPGMVRKDIMAAVRKMHPELDQARLTHVIHYLIGQKQIHARKMNGKTSKYYLGDTIDKQRVKIIPSGKWRLPSGQIYSPIEWSVHQLQVGA